MFQILLEQIIFPVRMEYSRLTKNIGINYLTSKKELWYTVEDVIASKILTGKTPEIIQALTFYPERKQSNLKNVRISDIEVNSSDDFIRKVIEERIRVKKSNRPDKDQIQLILKIIANATSYGIYIEENSETLENPIDVNVYSVDHFPFRTEKIEKQGVILQSNNGNLDNWVCKADSGIGRKHSRIKGILCLL